MNHRVTDLLVIYTNARLLLALLCWWILLFSSQETMIHCSNNPTAKPRNKVPVWSKLKTSVSCHHCALIDPSAKSEVSFKEILHTVTLMDLMKLYELYGCMNRKQWYCFRHNIRCIFIKHNSLVMRTKSGCWSLTAFQTQFAEIFQRDNQLLRLIAGAGLKTSQQTGAHTHIERHFPPAQLHRRSNCRQRRTLNRHLRDTNGKKTKGKVTLSVAMSLLLTSLVILPAPLILRRLSNLIRAKQRVSDETGSSFDLKCVNNDFNDDTWCAETVPEDWICPNLICGQCVVHSCVSVCALK